MSNVPIAITGMHRSGTSMITRALHDSGLHLIGPGAAELIDAAEDNPEGFWENKAIVACNEELLEAAGGSWDNPPDLLPAAVDDPRLTGLAEQCTSALAALAEHEPWGFKDPRTCLTAAYWLDLQPDLRFIVCVRHPLEVALSLKRRNQNSYSLGLALWERYYRSVLDLVPADRRIVTHYDTFFVDARGEIERLCAFAGLDPASPRVREDLRHHTIGVSLRDAGASAGLRALYAELCREAGAAVPIEPPSDEGRVRRLILDGAVAQRHADQRQDAIDRLNEREEELRVEHRATEEALRAERRAIEEELRGRARQLEQDLRQQRASLEAEHRARIQRLEARLLEAKEEAAQSLEALQRETQESVQQLAASMQRTEAMVTDVDGRTRTTADRLEVAIRHVQPGPVEIAARRWAGRVRRGTTRYLLRPAQKAVAGTKRAVTPVSRAATRQLPSPAQQALDKGGRLYRRGRSAPGPTAKAVGKKLRVEAAVRAKRLPPPAQGALRRTQRTLRATTSDPKTTARKLAARLPDPAADRLRRAWRSTQQARVDRAIEVRDRSDAPAPLPVPKGPPLRHWSEAYGEMVRSAWTGTAPWLAVVPGSSPEVCSARSPAATPFPAGQGGRPLADDQSHIAHLEALRIRGHHHLVVPEGSRGWFRQQSGMRDHIVRCYRTVRDDAGAGLVFDLDAPAGPEARSLRAEVRRLAAGLLSPPAVLDWTSSGLGEALPDTATFRPPEGEDLPYLDHSVDIVVIDRPERRPEAARVASIGVLVVDLDATDTTVRDTEAAPPADDGPAVHTPRVTVWAPPSSDPRWTATLTERVAAAGAELRLGPLDASHRPDVAPEDVLVVLEADVLPFPGALEAAAALAADRPTDAVTGKILDSEGRIESAGGIVFTDRSVGLIAARSLDVRAPWHEYLRPVCWGGGLLAASGALWSAVPMPGALEGRALAREWCAEVWATGHEVVYQPTVISVRVAGDGGEPSTPLVSSTWQRVLDLRPPRPVELGDGAWRHVLAHDDVEACRG